MVFFVCNVCGENLKKNQVEKHVSRRCNSFSCHDCSRDFTGETYAQHTKCISEEQKYYGSDYKPKAGSKGEQKQESWTEHVNAAIRQASGDPRLKAILEQIAGHPNIPRKKAKFANFLKNSLRIYDNRLVEQAWSVIEKQGEAAKNGNSAVSNVNGSTNATQSKANGHSTENGSRKRKADEELPAGSGDEKCARIDSNGVDHADEEKASMDKSNIEKTQQKFKWNRVIKSVLSETDSITIKKLKKRVRKQYKELASDQFDSDSFSEKFLAHLNSLAESATVQLDDEGQTVRLAA